MLFSDITPYEEYISIDACTYPWLTAASAVKDILTNETLDKLTLPKRKRFKDVLQEWLEKSAKRLYFSFDFNIYVLLRKLFKQCYIEKNDFKAHEYIPRLEEEKNSNHYVSQQQTAATQPISSQTGSWRDITMTSFKQDHSTTESKEEIQPPSPRDRNLLTPSQINDDTLLHQRENLSASTSSTALIESNDQEDHALSSMRFYTRWVSKLRNIPKTEKKPQRSLQCFSGLSFLTKKVDSANSFDATVFSEFSALSHDEREHTQSSAMRELNESSPLLFSNTGNKMFNTECFPDYLTMGTYREFHLKQILKMFEKQYSVILLQNIPLNAMQMAYSLLYLRFTNSMEEKISWMLQLYQLLCRQHKIFYKVQDPSVETILYNETIHLSISTLQTCTTEKIEFHQDVHWCSEGEKIVSLGLICLATLYELCRLASKESHYRISNRLTTVAQFFKWLYDFNAPQDKPSYTTLRRECLDVICRLVLLLHSYNTLKAEEDCVSQLCNTLNICLTTCNCSQSEDKNSVVTILTTLHILLPRLPNLERYAELHIPVLIPLLVVHLRDKDILQPALDIINRVYLAKPADVIEMLTGWSHACFWRFIIECCCSFRTNLSLASSGLLLFKNACQTFPEKIMSCLEEADFDKLIVNFIEVPDDFLKEIRPSLQVLNSLFVTFLSNHSIMSSVVKNCQDTLICSNESLGY